MTTSQLHDLMHAQPFRPFVLLMADGREYPVPHPDFIAYTQGGRVAFVMRDDDTGVLLDLLLMTGLEYRPVSGVRSGLPRDPMGS